MPETSAFIVRACDWKTDETDIASIRRRVFIQEQGVPEELEWERRDSECRWFIARTHDNAAIGIVRLTPQGRIGRMAVLPDWRGHGVGTSLLTEILRIAREAGLNSVHLSAQTQAVPFYSRFGFFAEGEGYMDAGIPHQTMTLELQ